MCGAVVVLYALGSELAWHGFGANVGLAFFPPAGITVVALLLSQRRHWPVLMAAVFGTEAIIDLTQHIPLRFALMYGVANAVEPVIGAVVVQRLNPHRVTLDQRVGKLAFIAGACVAGPLAGAVIGATGTSLYRSGTAWTDNLVHWWAGDGVAVLVIGASLMLCLTTSIPARHRIELASGALVAIPVALFGLSTPVAPATLALPLVAVMALRVGPVGATAVGSVLAVVANYWTNAGHGYFAEIDATATTRLAYLQLFLGVLVVVGWSIGNEVQARVRAVADAVRLEQQRSEATAAVEAIQRAIAPRTVDRDGPFRVGSCYQQSDVGGLVGGDWYDVFNLPDGRTMFAVGDVVGRGIEAVEDMAQLRLATRALACERHDSAQVVAELSHFAKVATHGRFATMLLAIYEPVGNVLTVSSAGHLPMLHWQAEKRSSTYLSTQPGPPLGVQHDAHYQQRPVVLLGGDLLVLYTDGVVERRRRPIDDSMSELREALDRNAESCSLDDLSQRLAECCEGDGTDDDRCVLVVRFSLDRRLDGSDVEATQRQETPNADTPAEQSLLPMAIDLTERSEEEANDLSSLR